MIRDPPEVTVEFVLGERIQPGREPKAIGPLVGIQGQFPVLENSWHPALRSDMAATFRRAASR